MEFSHFLSKISQLKEFIDDEKYNGLQFQLKMAPKERLNFDLNSVKDSKQAAVLALCYPKDDKTYLLLTLRAYYKGTHASQISFPGGKVDKKDQSLLQTALRESFEEVNVTTNLIDQTIELSKVYILPSNFTVSPFIAIAYKKPQFKANYEVAELIEVNIDDLLDESATLTKKITTSYANLINVPCYKLNNHIVWGATAMILSEIKELLKLTF